MVEKTDRGRRVCPGGLGRDREEGSGRYQGRMEGGEEVFKEGGDSLSEAVCGKRRERGRFGNGRLTSI